MSSPQGMLIDGIAASEALDSSGEILDVEGCDISTLDTEGVLNWEHRGDDSPGHSSSDIVGKIVFCKKVFGAKDCDNERQLSYWKRIELPFIYIIARLADAAGHSEAKNMAALIRDHHANNEPILVRFSIEGSTIGTDQSKKHLKESVARRVAATIKPCNRSCISGIIKDPQAPEGFDKNPGGEKKDFLEDALRRSEHQHPMFTRLGGHELECDPLMEEPDLAGALQKMEVIRKSTTIRCMECGKPPAYECKWAEGKARAWFCPEHWEAWSAKHKDDIDFARKLTDGYVDGAKYGEAPGETLSKTLTAGGYNAAPGTLVGGSALQVEDQSRRHRAWAHKAVEAMRKWDGSNDVRKFLKSRLPEASDEFVDRFADMVDSHRLSSKVKKSEATETLVRKFESWSLDLRRLAKAIEPEKQPELPAEVKFGGKRVRPGLATLTGPESNKKLALVNADERHYFGVPHDKAGGWQAQDLVAIPKNHKSGLIVHKDPEILDNGGTVDAAQHGSGLNSHDEQKQLIHGLNFDQPPARSQGPALPNDTYFASGDRSHWRQGTKNPVFVKAAESKEGPFNEARKEVAYHNLAKDFFGLGDYVPTTALIRHPKTGREHAVIDRVRGEHVSVPGWDPLDRYETPDKPEHRQQLTRLGDSGELDRLAVMNHVLGNNDRHELNYMLTPEGGMKLIDHGLAFATAHRVNPLAPDYLTHYHATKDRDSGQKQRSLDTEALHPDAQKWLQGLDEQQLAQHLEQNQVPAPEAVEAQWRLRNMKQRLAASPQLSKNKLLGAHTTPEENGVVIQGAQ